MREPTLLDMFTIRGDAERRSSGSIALVTRMTPITLVSTTVRTVARSTVVGCCGMPPVIAGVVDQDVEAPGLLLDQLGGGGDARVVGHVERHAERVDAGRAQLLHRGLPALLVAGADPDAPAEGAQAGRDLVSDSLVRAGHQRDRRVHS